MTINTNSETITKGPINYYVTDSRNSQYSTFKS